MRALRLYAGAAALKHIRQHGLSVEAVGIVAAAAGGPKGLILGPLDRFIFGEWLAGSAQPIDLVGASIGAWRMATACLHDAVAAFERLQRDYIAQDYVVEPGRRMPTPEHVSAVFAANLRAFFGTRLHEILQHPRYRLHVLTTRGRHLLAREGRWRTPLGYLGASLTNVVQRGALGLWLERVVFSTALPAASGGAPAAMPASQAADTEAVRDVSWPQTTVGVPLTPSGSDGALAPLPFDARDFRTRQVPLRADNFMPAVQASCSIPFALRAVHDIPHAPPGAYWDGGITDYHLHLRWRAERGLVLYPHFQRQVVPGWLDKGLRWRHRPTAALDHTIVLAPDPQWASRLPNGKLPDRTDFARYGHRLAERMQAWQTAVREAQRLADEFAAWLQRPNPARVEPL
ncbi:phospholipase [Tepidimonas sp.]|uniref:phospholipase n=1 Tax=Tepidimonas sp. TaxID=2002775 RepID=UPI002FE2CF5E